ncbi:DUF222 domain-containing protein [Cellulomonas denverensis]|uniref:DUF222 domain-containing protein n=1 Tax=Cellulomonas denverensis TaxID=264297 RepID=UPI0035EAAF0A
MGPDLREHDPDTTSGVVGLPGSAMVAAEPDQAVWDLLLAPPTPPQDAPERGDGVTAWARKLATVAPGPSLATLLDTVPADSLTDDEAVEMVAAARRMAAWADAKAAAWAATLAHRDSMRPTGSPSTRMQDGCLAADELAMRLAESRQTSAALVASGVAFEGILHPVGEALAGGQVDARRARVLVDRLHGMDAEVMIEVQERVLPEAGRRTVTQLRRDVDRVLVEVGGAYAADEHRRARRTRRVTHPMLLADGMAGMWWVLPAVDAARVDGLLDTAARTARTAGDPRTLDQLRADGLRDLVLGPPPWTADLDNPVGRATRPGPDSAHTVESRNPATGTSSTRASSADYCPTRSDAFGMTGTHGTDNPPGCAHALVGTRDTGDPHTTDADVAAGPGGRVVSGTEDASAPGSGTGAVVAMGTGSDAGTGTQDAGGPTHRPASTGTCTRPHGATTVHVTVALTTLLGLDERPGDLHGIGPVDADQARQAAFAAGATWRRLVTDPQTGAVLDVGRRRYRPPDPLAAHVRARDRRCARPGCDVPATRCDLDHTIEFNGPPPHHPGNHHPARHHRRDQPRALCRHDHTLKSGAGFVLRQPEPGVFEWLTPTGHRYRLRPGADRAPAHLSTDPRWLTGRALTQAELDDPPPF